MRSEIIQLEDCLSGNVSQISVLTAEIASLNKDILGLRSIAAQENAESGKLKQKIGELTGLLDQVKAELEGLVEAEEIYLVVNRVREMPTAPIEAP